MQSQKGLPIRELALTNIEKKRKGRERSFDERAQPSPHSHSFPPLFPPCPAEVIWQRGGGSISQFTQAGAAFCTLASLSLVMPDLHPRAPLCSVRVAFYLPVSVCARCPHSDGMISSTFRWEKVSNPLGWQHLLDTSCAAQVSPPTFIHPLVSHVSVQHGTHPHLAFFCCVFCFPYNKVFVSSFEQRKGKGLRVLHD